MSIDRWLIRDSVGNWSLNFCRSSAIRRNRTLFVFSLGIWISLDWSDPIDQNLSRLQTSLIATSLISRPSSSSSQNSMIPRPPWSRNLLDLEILRHTRLAWASTSRNTHRSRENFLSTRAISRWYPWSVPIRRLARASTSRNTHVNRANFLSTAPFHVDLLDLHPLENFWASLSVVPIHKSFLTHGLFARIF